jgi:hypothetical protein
MILLVLFVLLDVGDDDDDDDPLGIDRFNPAFLLLLLVLLRLAEEENEFSIIPGMMVNVLIC